MEFKIQSNNPWDTLQIADGKELKVGERIYSGKRPILIEGKETFFAEPIWGGDYILDNGKMVTVTDGVITEIKDAPAPATAKVEAAERKKAYKTK